MRLPCGVQLVALVALAPLVTAQPLARLERLTVPADRLPAGCHLPQSSSSIDADGKSVRARLWAGLPITTNPWSGTDALIVSRIRERSDPPPRSVDGPPMTSTELARARMRLADDVEAAYAAVYADEDHRLVVVTAYKLTGKESLVTRVAGQGGVCDAAVAAHVKNAAQ